MAAISVAKCNKCRFCGVHGPNNKMVNGKTSCCQVKLLKNMDGRNSESFEVRVLRHRRACGNGGGQKSKPTERFPLRLVATISRTIANHAQKSRGVPLNAIESGVGPHGNDDTGDAHFEEIRMPEQKFCDQYTCLVLDPDGLRGHLNQCKCRRLLRKWADNLTEGGDEPAPLKSRTQQQ